MAPNTPLIAQRSRSRIPPLHLHRPSTVEEAMDAYLAGEGAAAFMAGGIDLVNRMKNGATLKHLVHLGRIAELTRLEAGAGNLSIGAGIAHREAAASALVRECFPSLAQTCAMLGNPRVRIKGTLGGNLMSREPAYDIAPMLMALGASLVCVDVALCRRRLPVADLSAADGLLAAIELPLDRRVVLRIDRSLRPAVGLAVGLEQAGGLIAAARVAVSCAYAAPRVFPLELPHPLSAAELARRAPALSEAFALALPEPREDWQAGSRFRRRMIRILLQRLLTRQEDTR